MVYKGHSTNDAGFVELPVVVIPFVILFFLFYNSINIQYSKAIKMESSCIRCASDVIPKRSLYSAVNNLGVQLCPYSNNT